jgi:transposase
LEADLDIFFAMLGAKKSAAIELAAMDMWKPFRNSLTKSAPNAQVVFDKFHITRHLGDALDEVRRSEYRRLAGKDRTFIKGPRQSPRSPDSPREKERRGARLGGKRAVPAEHRQ